MKVKSNLLTAKCHVKFILFLFALLLAFNSTSQIRLDTSKKVRTILLPIVFNTPETGVAFGLTNSISFKTTPHLDSTTRISSIQTLGFFTMRKQNVEAVDASIYFPKENYILLMSVSHSYFPDKFWGIGQRTKNKSGEHYAFEQFFINPHFKKRLTKRLFAGVLYEFQRVYKLNYIEGGLFDSAKISGKTDHNMSGMGVSLGYDTRNSAFWPSKGFFLQTILTNFRTDMFFSDYDMTKWIGDFRFFKKIYKANIIAFQIYNYFTVGSTPIRQLATFGGANNMRGFYQGRFRDKNLVSFIAEYRTTIVGRFGATVFGGVGNVYNSLTEVGKAEIKYSYGAGLRFAILKKEKLNIRLDYGYSSRYNQGLYFTVGECF